nr:alcohol dehydrogenase catalytic domain-containing protein [Lachnospiraceae bacterium]
MRAYVYKYQDGIKQKKINAPGCTMGSVMVSVGAAGISEYDIEQIYGENRSVMTVIPGHEVSGTVVGPVNTEWNGKRVAV